MRHVPRHESREVVAHLAAQGIHILRRGATLVFRRRVPASLARVRKQSVFAFSLRTHVLSEGRRRAAFAARCTDDLIGWVEAFGKPAPCTTWLARRRAPHRKSDTQPGSSGALPLTTSVVSQSVRT
ncbi:DUF6538 domain-containing protein [Roseicyclus sp.]|uniref:DUF6538 domain-containing protein n=1 Tax=Roseicyclus sp. TaxID=1914329 RepID=UPI003FA0C51A